MDSSKQKAWPKKRLSVDWKNIPLPVNEVFAHSASRLGHGFSVDLLQLELLSTSQEETF